MTGLTRREAACSFLTISAMIGLSGCNLPRSASYRLRVTVESDTPQGSRIGSSVLEVLSSKNLRLTSEEHAFSSGIRGEAISLDALSGPVFVVLRYPTAGKAFVQAVTFALAPDLRDGGGEAFLKAVERLSGWFGSAKAELPREDWPMMVRFDDLNEPKSVEQIDPASAGISRILLETTSDEVTTGIQKRLPWLTDGGLTLDPAAGPTINPTFAQTLRQRDFSTLIER